MRRVASFFRVDDDNPLTGWHVLGIVGLFFGTIIGVNVVLATYATGTFPGLVVKNSYVASQNYNALLAGSRAQAALGWTAELSAPDGLLSVRLADQSGAPLAGLIVSARIGRPASAGEDRVVELSPAAGGYSADEALAPGRWIVELEARSGGELAYRATHPFVVSGGGS
ncbi:MAG: FixH family protein [Propylenella sp.]